MKGLSFVHLSYVHAYRPGFCLMHLVAAYSKIFGRWIIVGLIRGVLYFWSASNSKVFIFLLLLKIYILTKNETYTHFYKWLIIVKSMYLDLLEVLFITKLNTNSSDPINKFQSHFPHHRQWNYQNPPLLKIVQGLFKIKVFLSLNLPILHRKSRLVPVFQPHLPPDTFPKQCNTHLHFKAHVLSSVLSLGSISRCWKWSLAPSCSTALQQCLPLPTWRLLLFWSSSPCSCVTTKIHYSKLCTNHDQQFGNC